jgi:hypothetical protein
MSVTRTFTATKYAPDHFEPEIDDPTAQRKLRGYLEQIDYTAFISNREVIAQVVGKVEASHFQKLAVAAATARARWVAEAMASADGGAGAAPERLARLAQLRGAYEELAEAYEALRRMVERGYLNYSPAQS